MPGTRKRSAPPLYPYDEQNALVRLPGPIVEEVRQMVQAGDIPGAVKRVDELIGAGLSSRPRSMWMDCALPLNRDKFHLEQMFDN